MKTRPPINAQAVVLDTAFETPCRGLWVGTAGDVSVDFAGGATGVVFVGAQGLLPGEFARVNTVGTTASDILALF